MRSSYLGFKNDPDSAELWTEPGVLEYHVRKYQVSFQVVDHQTPVESRMLLPLDSGDSPG